jgi:hypothetical protein
MISQVDIIKQDVTPKRALKFVEMYIKYGNYN